MKKKFLGVISILFLLSTAATTVLAAPKDLKSNDNDPFQATYRGIIHGDKGSQAPLTLALTQVNDQISGTVYLGRGLYIDAGRCGGGYLPAAIQSAEGEVNKYDPNLLEASTAFKVSGFKVSIDLEGLLSSDGDLLETEAKIDLPWLCGRDPIINGTLYKQQQS
ncbi:MAG: hypothetical protein BMS9Abin02_1899 [Anaerolineae bacterium]|nr:MAG: hypothetical protein BMS9Abin02_1899 [Anaerolineae bacterium]